MRNLAHEAGFRALEERKEGRGCVMVLMPPGWGAIAFEMGQWPAGVWPRFSNKHAALRSLPVETLIIVGRGHQYEGVMLARELMRGQIHPRLVIVLPGDEPNKVLELNGAACFADDSLLAVEFAEPGADGRSPFEDED